ncbi:DUF3825 domain-containing protein [Christensenellaceae bacterium OttesenSCG-928-M15]|nr:DUF3825 domain-containing protein [Christensenellaceae bacterium OttesenSCG-928-M15]
MAQASLFDFCRVDHWHSKLRLLEDLAIGEDWQNREYNESVNNWQNPILENYIRNTARRLFDLCELYPQEKDRWILFTDKQCVFHTGLFTSQYTPIYGVMYYNKQLDGLNWSFAGYFKQTDKYLMQIKEFPEKAVYFDHITDLIYDTRLELRVNLAHILEDEKNLERVPETIRNMPYLQSIFEGAIQIAKRKIEYDYKLAIPCYYDKRINFLIPLCLCDMETPDLALAVSKQADYYYGHTCLTLDMAYSNARSISPPAGWLAR